MHNVRDMFNYCKENNILLLSDYDATFWNEYVNNNLYVDGSFDMQYRSFVFFDQKEDDSLEDVVTSFISAVKNWLFINDKRYSELYRICTISDDNYSILDNYRINVSNNNVRNIASNDMFGQRTDIENNTLGEQSFENLDKVTGHNSNNLNSKDGSQSKNGSRNDVNQFTKGAQNNTSRSEIRDSGGETKSGVLNKSQAEVIDEHKKFWNSFNFYSVVFGDICEQFLMIN